MTIKIRTPAEGGQVRGDGREPDWTRREQKVRVLHDLASVLVGNAHGPGVLLAQFHNSLWCDEVTGEGRYEAERLRKQCIVSICTVVLLVTLPSLVNRQCTYTVAQNKKSMLRI